MQSKYAQLDNPVWHAIEGIHRHLGHQGQLACRYEADVSPFAAVIEPTAEALLELHQLIRAGGAVIAPFLAALPPMPTLEITHLGNVLQMVAHDSPALVSDEGVRPLGPTDLEDMLQLVAATRPGPFGRRTPEMGNYLGIHDKGRLIAMAGERMQLNGFVEISAVCVDDAYRGKGLAARLMNILRRDILRRGDLPFLHVLAENTTAISVYRRLGFEDRQTFLLHQLRCN